MKSKFAIILIFLSQTGCQKSYQASSSPNKVYTVPSATVSPTPTSAASPTPTPAGSTDTSGTDILGGIVHYAAICGPTVCDEVAQERLESSIIISDEPFDK